MVVATELPVKLPWDTFYALEEQQNGQGQHRLFLGPTQSGKTTLCRKIAALRGYVVVLGTKNVDESLDAYLIEGYKRIYQWPPTKKEIEEATQPDGSVRFILWPKITELSELNDPKTKLAFTKLFNQAYKEGYWTIVCDESLWLADKEGLDMDRILSKMAFASASNKVSLYLCMQRPSGISRITWSSVTDVYMFHMGVTQDVVEMAALGRHSPKEVRDAMASLGDREFLKLPIRANAEWSTSKITPQAAQAKRTEFSTTA